MRNSYLPPASQPWAKEIERALEELRHKTAAIDNTATSAQRSIEQSMPTIGFANAIPDRIDSVEQTAQDAYSQSNTATQSADGANTWSTRDPISPPSTETVTADIPYNDNAMWFTTDDAGTTLRMWQWVPSGMDPEANGYIPGQWTQQKFNTETVAPGAITAEQLAPGINSTIDDAQAAANQAMIDAASAVVLRIDSSRGLVFKNSMVSTVLTVTVFAKSKTITDIVDLQEAFGPGAYLEWRWKRLDDSDFGVLSSADSRISNGGFSLTVSPEDVDTKVVFMCTLSV